MASGKITLGLATILVIMLCTETEAQSSSGCTNVLISMSPCLNYITGNSSTPSSQCCSQLANVVRSSPQCLCEVLNGGGSSMGININQTQALALPTACNVQTPSISRCNSGSPTGSPAAPSTPSGSGTKDVPSTDTSGTSDGSSIKLSISLLFFLLFAASYGSTIQIGGFFLIG
uniref:Non-specific lipid transfer protein A n=1 Tax=Rhizophora mucronata TaxID=61149 RepID=A0A2P2INJ9_RHIMU